MVTICTASLTFNNSTFCPHTVFMCFVWISEQTAIISLYNKLTGFITEPQCVYCAVRRECLNVIQANFSLQNVTNFRRQRSCSAAAICTCIIALSSDWCPTEGSRSSHRPFQTCSFCQHLVPMTAAPSHLLYAAEHMKKQKTGKVRTT